jgi:hypothetical protein
MAKGFDTKSHRHEFEHLMIVRTTRGADTDRTERTFLCTRSDCMTTLVVTDERCRDAGIRQTRVAHEESRNTRRFPD